MTDVFYVAVKGSLHASDSSVFGLNNEEIAALSRRFNDAKKEVINGVLIKANPLQVINSLSELGYRVACCSGEAEIVWTLRREVLDQDFRLSDDGIGARVRYATKTPESYALPTLSEREIAKRQEENKYMRGQPVDDKFERKTFVSSRPPSREKPRKRVERIGTKPEDLAEYLHYTGSRILITSPEDIENIPEGQKVIIKTNESSSNNPMVSWGSPETREMPDRRDARGRDVPVYFSEVEPVITCTDNMACARDPPVPSVHQTLDEMDFERGLWYPALIGDLSRVKALLNKGYDPNAEDRNGYTALHYAARCGFSNICSHLLEAGASVNKTTRAGGSTPLHRAALAGTDEAVVVLIKNGANITAKDVDGRIPLHRAAEANHPTTVALLLEASPESAVIKDRNGKTARHYINPDNKAVLELFDIIEGKPSAPRESAASSSTRTVPASPTRTKSPSPGKTSKQSVNPKKLSDKSTKD